MIKAIVNSKWHVILRKTVCSKLFVQNSLVATDSWDLELSQMWNSVWPDAGLRLFHGREDEA